MYNSTMSKTNKHSITYLKWAHNKNAQLCIAALVFIFIYAISMYTPVIGGYTSYPVAIIRCGRLPVITSDFMAGYDYSEPGMASYHGPNWLNTNKNYVCTAQDAEKQGYHKAAW